MSGSSSEQARRQQVEYALALMRLPRNFTVQQLREQFRVMAMSAHPDKPGGSAAAFVKLKSAVQELLRDFEIRTSDRQFDELRQQAQAEIQRQTQQNQAGARGGGGDTYCRMNDRSFNLNRFNAEFEEQRQPDAFSAGYADAMAASTGTAREDFLIPRMSGTTPEDFNNEFVRSSASLPPNKHVMVYRCPSAMTVTLGRGRGGGDFWEINRTSVDDFGGRTSTLEFSDYMAAHSTRRLVDPESVVARPEFKNVDTFRDYRDSATRRQMTEEEMNEAAGMWGGGG